MDRDINRLKVVLAEKKRTNKWLASQLGVALQRFQNGVPMFASQALRHFSKLQTIWALRFRNL